MSRRRGKSETAPSLFPFLAVLLCTIGALVLMLILTVSNAGVAARQVIAAEQSEENVEAEDVLHVVVDQLKAERVRANELVENMRGKLQSFESQIVDLTKELKRLQIKESAIRDQSVLTEQQRADRESELAKLRVQRDQIEKEIERKNQEAADKPPAFAILPYQGPNGTTRRPIYLECTEQGLVIQPEGVLLSLRDLAPPHGPGNPLDAALRTIRSFYQELDASTSSYSAPYPLLIVRPAGIKSFAMARGAMSGWDDQFGYELVDAKMPLAYPEGAPGLKPRIEDSVVVARQRQAALIAALPRQVFDPDQLEELLAKPIGDNQLGPSNTGNNKSGSIKDPENWKVVGDLPEGGNFVLGNAAQSPTGPNNIPQNGSGTGKLLESNLAKSLANDLAMEQLRGPQGFRDAGLPNSGGTYEPSSAQNARGGSSTQFQGSGSGSNAGEPGSNGTQPSSPNQANGASGNPNFSSQGQAGSGSNVPNGSPSMKPDPHDPTQFNSNAANQMRDPPSLSIEAKSNSNTDNSVKPISVSQGRDWATSRAEGKATAIARTINMVVLPNAWVLIADNNRGQAQETIRLSDGLSNGSQQLARLIRERVDDWGVAVAGGYWKPKLTIEVPSEDLYSLKSLLRLLEGSGMDVQVIPLQAAVPANVPR